MLKKAEDTGDLKTTLAAVREARATLETLARLSVPTARDTEDGDPALDGEDDVPPYWKFLIECVADEFRHWPNALSGSRTESRLRVTND